MGMFENAANAIKNFILIQAQLDQLEKAVERQDRDIAGLREVMVRFSERLVRVETIIDEARGARQARRALPED